MFRFKDFSLAKKLAMGFGVVLVLLISISVIGFNALGTASDGFKEYRGLARNTNNGGRVQANVLSMRLAALGYYNTTNEEQLKTQRERFGKLKELIGDAKKDAVDEEQRKAYDKMDQIVAGYGNIFDEIVTLINHRHELVRQNLDVIGPEMEHTLTDITISARKDNDMSAAFYSSQAMRNLLVARVYVVKYLVRNLPERADRVQKEFRGFKENLAVLDRELQNAGRRAKLAKVADMSDKYIGAFNDLVKTIETRNKLKVEKLDPAGREVAKLVEDLKLEIKGRQDELGPAVQASNERAVTFLITVAIIAVLFGVFMAFIITRAVTGPVRKVMEFTSRFGEGDLTAKLEVDTKDEIGQMAEALSNAVGKLQETVAGINSAVANIASASEEVSSTAQTMSQGASEQAANVEETSSSVEQMTASINQNTENAKATDSIATKAASEATEGGEAVRKTVDAMNDIAAKIGIIEDIAYKTNLLALNAAIEAARAGEHGKGFAVVADEVRKLAERSQTAAQEISNQAGDSVRIAETAGTLLEQIVPSINKTAELVQEITAASEEQSSGVVQINTAMEQLNQVTQQNASASEELAATSEEMSSQAEQLQQMMSFFKVDGNAAIAAQTLVSAPKGKIKASFGGKAVAADKEASNDGDEHHFVRF